MAKGYSFDAMAKVLYPCNYTSLDPTVDLNTINSASQVGVYYQNKSYNATPAMNYPTQQAGALEVLPTPMKAGVGAIQRYTVYTNGDTYTRGIYGNAISVWQKMISNVDVAKAIYPIGIVVTFAVEVDPNTAFPGTTWTRITDTKQVRPSESAASIGTIGGADVYTLSAENMPNHNHRIAEHTHTVAEHRHPINHDHANATTASAGAHTHDVQRYSGPGSDRGLSIYASNVTNGFQTTTRSGAHTHDVDIPTFYGSSGSAGGSTDPGGPGATGYTGSTTEFSTSGAWRKYGIWQRTA